MTQQAPAPIEALTQVISNIVNQVGYEKLLPSRTGWLEALHKYSPALYAEHLADARRQGFDV